MEKSLKKSLIEAWGENGRLKHELLKLSHSTGGFKKNRHFSSSKSGQASSDQIWDIYLHL